MTAGTFLHRYAAGHMTGLVSSLHARAQELAASTRAGTPAFGAAAAQAKESIGPMVRRDHD